MCSFALLNRTVDRSGLPSRDFNGAYTRDAFGNLAAVNEPNPQGGADYVTSYSYDALNHLTQVTMTRGGTTQTRSFSYDATTHRLTHTVTPEGVPSNTRTTRMGRCSRRSIKKARRSSISTIPTRGRRT